MTHQEIKELAGHRAVSPWIMKLVSDALNKEREEIIDLVALYGGPVDLEAAIRRRGNK